MKKTTVALSLVLALAVAYPAASWVTGKRIEDKLAQTKSQDILFSNFKVVKQSYKRGLFSSTQNSTIEFHFAGSKDCTPKAKPLGGADGEAPALSIDEANAILAAQDRSLQFQVINHIQHGPVPGIAGIAAAKIETELVIEPQTLVELKKIFGEKKFLEITTILNYGGGGKFTVSSPAVVTNFGSVQSKADWKGVKLELGFDADYKKIHVDLNAPGLDANSPNGRSSIKMGALKIAGDVERAFPNSLLFLGKSMASLDSLDIVNGEANGVDFGMKNIAIESNTLNKNDFIDTSLKFGIGKIKVAKAELSDFHYDYSLTHLHAASISQFFKDISAIDECKPNPENLVAMMDKWKKLGVEILKNEPVLSLDRLSVASKTGEFKATGKLKFVGATVEDFENMQALMLKLEATLDVAMAEAIIGEIIEGAQTDPQARAAAMNAINAQIAEMEKQTYIKRDGKTLKSQLIWRAGKAQVNGKAFPAVQE
jgi:uncharacterized protein YdgA (DUF945 family)